ncbi:MAG: sulfite exporter TauE/SafE family protein [Pseudomonadota bacterium]|nr:sulfite exporter TauE/SafE family protein [Pseudomonadota bacterium]
MTPLLFIAGAGIIAGMMNGLVGGGSFVTIPALIAVGLPSVTANTTSTVALFPGQLTTAWTYRDGLGPVGPVSLRTLLVATFLGGVIGALLLLRTPITAFDLILPWLLAIATLMLAFGRQLGEALRSRWHIGVPLVVAVQFCLGAYGGYFGGGVGIMMMAVWSLLSDRTLKSFNAPRTLMICAANTVAVFIFIAAHAVRWPEALSLLAGAVLGGYCGANIGRRAPAGAVRVGTLLVSVGITLVFFARAYLK